MNWLIIILLILLVFFIIKGYEHKISKVLILLLVLILIASIFSIFRVTKNSGIELTTTSGIALATKVYFKWLANAFDNFKTITGNAVKMNWAPNQKDLENSTLKSSGQK